RGPLARPAALARGLSFPGPARAGLLRGPHPRAGHRPRRRREHPQGAWPRPRGGGACAAQRAADVVGVDAMAEPAIHAYRGRVDDVKALLARIPKGVQLLRADRVYGPDHLRLAARLAARAVAEGRARSADLPTETLLYAAGERQVGKAIAFLGLHAGVVAIAAGPTVLDAFGVSPEERAMLPPSRWDELVLERVALTDVLKA